VKPAQADLVLDARASLGECPVWCHSTQCLWWVDIIDPSVNRFDPSTGANVRYAMPSPVGAIALRAAGGLLVALATGFATFDPLTGGISHIVDPEPDLPEARMNDGRCDRDGRFWCGSMIDPPDPCRPLGRLHRLGRGRRTFALVDGLMVPNGLAFSPDGKIMYLSDSHPTVRTIWRFDFDRDDGIPYNRRLFADTRGMPGRPDGAAVDADGCYWSAANDGGELVRYTPDGRIDRRISVPARKPSMPAFGGRDLRTLFFTTIRPANSAAELHDGGIYAVDVGVAGLAEALFVE
jgi:L-arabinonolactonase